MSDSLKIREDRAGMKSRDGQIWGIQEWEVEKGDEAVKFSG